LLSALEPSLPPRPAEWRRLPGAPQRLLRHFSPAPTGLHESLMASGPEATTAINLARSAELQCRTHNFSTKCLLMDRPVPTLCIDALPHEASNWPDVPMLIRDWVRGAPQKCQGVAFRQDGRQY
jgi:hypothetical protein